MLTTWMPSARFAGKSIVFACFFAMLGVPTVWAAPQARSQPEAARSLAQAESAPIKVIGIKLNSTATQLEIILETQDGKPLSVDASKFKTVGNSLIADLPAVLAIPNAQTFTATAPTGDIATVSVTQIDATNIQVSVTGTTALPTTAVTLKAGTLTYSLNPAAPDPELEILVTGTRKNEYRVPNTSVGTKTDTPLRDIPQAIQVVPKQVLQDQQVTRLDDALRNVAGVTQSFNFGPFTFYNIRGFDATETNLLRNGQIDILSGQVTELSSVDRVEVLKGPASVLFGLGNPGGSINIVSKMPLSTPLANADVTIGSNNLYRGAIDFSGPLNDSKSVLYRLNLAYKNSGSFVDFLNGESLNISPVVSVALSDKTNLTVETEYIKSRDSNASGIPVVGSILPNPNGTVSRNLNLYEPSDRIEQNIIRLGTKVDHKFNENWSLNNSLLFVSRNLFQRRTDIIGLEPDNRTVTRSFSESSSENKNYALTTNVTGKFTTGSVGHQLLVGIDLNRFDNNSPLRPSFGAASIDIFNPVYGGSPSTISNGNFGESGLRQQTNSLGIYVQDQLALKDNLKFLVGGRFDFVDRQYNDFVANTSSSGSDSAFSPRVGVVYQPTKAISLYSSYTSSFTPPGGSYFFGVDSSFKPERGTQYEVGVKADINDRLSATLALFDLTRSNVTTADPDNPAVSIQVGEQKSKGLELSLAGKIAPGWNISTSYAYTDARITRDNTLPVGNRLSNVPNHAASLWTSYEISSGNLQGWGAGLGLFYVGDRADFDNSYTVPSYLRTDASIFYKRDQLKASLSFKNLFNTNYFESSLGSRVYVGQPFTVQANVGLEF